MEADDLRLLGPGTGPGSGHVGGHQPGRGPDRERVPPPPPRRIVVVVSSSCDGEDDGVPGGRAAPRVHPPAPAARPSLISQDVACTVIVGVLLK